MSSIKSDIEEIRYRIIELSSIYPTAKEFLNICDIENHSFITDLKKGRIKNPSSEYLLKIVRGTGCSGTWLLTGEGEKYEVRQNAAKAFKGENSFSLINQAFELLDRIEQKVAGSSTDPLPVDVELALTRLLYTNAERRQKARNSGD